jgi:hypothetical protein
VIMFRAVREKKHILQLANTLGESTHGVVALESGRFPAGTHTHKPGR